MSLLPPKPEGSSSPSNTLGHDASTLSASAANQSDGSGLFHWSFTLGRHRGEQEEVKALDEATQQALAPHSRPSGPWMEPDSGSTHWKVLAHEAMDTEDVQALCRAIIEWTNDTLADRRIVIKDVREDFYDGQVLSDLMDELTGGSNHMMPSVVAQSEKSQRDRLKAVLSVVNDILRVGEDEAGWSVGSIHACDMVATLKLLVAMIRHFSPKTRLPPGVTLEVMEIERTASGMNAKTVKEYITTELLHRVILVLKDNGLYCYGETAEGQSKRNHTDGRHEYQPDDDVFDKLFNEAPEKVDAVKTVLTKFANNHLNRVGVTITDPGSDMRSGVALLMLLQLVGDYFLPLQDYRINPSLKDEFLLNNGLVIRLMQEQNIITSGCPATPDDLMNGDLKSIFRLLYAVFRMEKHRAQQKAMNQEQGQSPSMPRAAAPAHAPMSPRSHEQQSASFVSSIV